ncbi:MAG: glycoside hydrolase N-terminal domain-containing protein [Rhizobium sp.]|nr:glycoside hydrolase N-terminal domain-containing protein [Rhizobium sp.]
MFAGKYAGTRRRLADATMMSRPRMQMTYQPAGWVFIETRHRPDRDSFKRWLDLETAIASVDYRHQGISYKRETFASAPDNAHRHTHVDRWRRDFQHRYQLRHRADRRTGHRCGAWRNHLPRAQPR